MENATATGGSLALRVQRFFVRSDAIYDHYESTYQAKSPFEKAIYLFLYLLPGIVAYVFINIGPVFRAEMSLTGLSAKYLQYAWVLIITFGWHTLVPFLPGPEPCGLARFVPRVPGVCPAVRAYFTAVHEGSYGRRLRAG